MTDPVLLINILLVVIAIVAAIAAMLVRDLLSSVMLLGIYSLLLAVEWANLFAMDVSYTEAAVGAGATTILLLAALTRTGTREKDGPAIHGTALLTVIVTGAVLLYGTSDLPHFGDPQAPAQVHVAPGYIAQNVGKVYQNPLADPAEGDFGHHVPNTVTAVLASYRGYDTMFETAVIFTAGICVILLLRPTAQQRARKENT
jgi:multicomponent Na+:H+ antiporter subunit B